MNDVILQSQSFLMTLFELRFVDGIREGINVKSGEGTRVNSL
jgi:hypothetical protein